MRSPHLRQNVVFFSITFFVLSPHTTIILLICSFVNIILIFLAFANLTLPGISSLELPTTAPTDSCQVGHFCQPGY